VAVREWQGEVIFLHQIIEGAADKSYGIHVAQMAGVPREVNRRATELLASLEASASPVAQRHESTTGANGAPAMRAHRGATASRNGHFQLTLFELAEHPLLDAIRQLDIDATTPRDALQLVHEWQQQLADEPQRRKAVTSG
jgi:DNA mismatch repair protein MutS